MPAIFRFQINSGPILQLLDSRKVQGNIVDMAVVQGTDSVLYSTDDAMGRLSIYVPAQIDGQVEKITDLLGQCINNKDHPALKATTRLSSLYPYEDFRKRGNEPD